MPRRQTATALGRRFGGGLILLAAVATGCAGPVLPSPIASSPETTFQLLYNTDGFCPLAGSYDVTFRIDALAGEPVVAVGDNGQVHQVRWPQAFVGGTADDPVVRDGRGRVVARDGERLTSPAAGFPNLHGYSVCFGGGTLWVSDHSIGLFQWSDQPQIVDAPKRPISHSPVDAT